MPYSYTVRHAFSHDGKWYSRSNAAEIASLPRSVRDPLIEKGFIVEHHHDPAEEPEETPAAEEPDETQEGEE